MPKEDKNKKCKNMTTKLKEKLDELNEYYSGCDKRDPNNINSKDFLNSND